MEMEKELSNSIIVDVTADEINAIMRLWQLMETFPKTLSILAYNHEHEGSVMTRTIAISKELPDSSGRTKEITSRDFPY